MPIRVNAAEEQLQNSPEPQKQSLHLVTDEVIWTHKPELMQQERAAFPIRIFAHCLDLMVVQGFGLYTGKLWSLVLLSGYMKEINHTGKWASDILLDVFSFGNGLLAVGCILGASFFYFVLAPLFFEGKTFGLALMGMKIETEDRSPLTMKNLLIRFACYFISYFSLGFAFLLGMRHKQGALLHDEISKTLVVMSRS